MAVLPFHFAFNYSETEYWPTLASGQSIPDTLKSKHNPNSGSLGLGMVEAASALLTGSVRIGREGDDFSVVYESSSEGGGTRVASSIAHPSSASGSPERLWHGTNATQAPTLLCILEASLLETTSAGCRTDKLDETRARWQALLEELELTTLETAPYTKQQIVQAAQDQQCRRAMMALGDSVYFTLKRMGNADEREYDDTAGREYGPLPGRDEDHLFDREPQAGQPEGKVMPQGHLTATLSGLVETGGTCLLVGPTGTFKTTTATRVADQTGAQLQVVKGRPGIEDRDFFGGVMPAEADAEEADDEGESGPTWRDGPVTKAFRKGRQGKTMLLMDELLRFEPLFLGAFVGLLDPASPAELSARGIEPAPGFETEEHYVAELPTGEEIACPTSRLTLVATTNMGADYVQAGKGLDAALMGRFELTVEVERPDPDVKRHLYEEEMGCSRGADLLEAIEETVEAGHIDKGGLYVRKAHPRLMLNMAGQMKRVLEEPIPETDADALTDAAKQAARVTVVPNCVERQADGLLDPSGKDSLLQDVIESAGDVL